MKLSGVSVAQFKDERFELQDWESSIGLAASDWPAEQPDKKDQVESIRERHRELLACLACTAHGRAAKETVRKWAELQAGQRILVTTPSIVVGYRCQVYRSEGATQWYTAVIVGHDEDSGVLLDLLPPLMKTLCHTINQSTSV